MGYASSSFLGSASTPASWHWMLDREAQESVVVVIFSSRDAAEAFQKNVEGNAANQAAAAIKLVKICVLEVTASA